MAEQDASRAAHLELSCAEVAEALPRDLALLALSYTVDDWRSTENAWAFRAAAAEGGLAFMRWLAAHVNLAKEGTSGGFFLGELMEYEYPEYRPEWRWADDPLRVACGGGHEDVVRWLVELHGPEGFDPLCTPRALRAAREAGHCELARWLGAQLDAADDTAPPRVLPSATRRRRRPDGDACAPDRAARRSAPSGSFAPALRPCVSLVFAFAMPDDAARLGRAAAWLAPALRAWWASPALCAVWRAAALRHLVAFVREAPWRDPRWVRGDPLLRKNPPPCPVLPPNPMAILRWVPRAADFRRPRLSSRPPDEARFACESLALADEAARTFAAEGGAELRVGTGFLLAAVSSLRPAPPEASEVALADWLVFGRDAGRSGGGDLSAAAEALQLALRRPYPSDDAGDRIGRRLERAIWRHDKERALRWATELWPACPSAADLRRDLAALSLRRGEPPHFRARAATVAALEPYFDKRDDTWEPAKLLCRRWGAWDGGRWHSTEMRRLCAAARALALQAAPA